MNTPKLYVLVGVPASGKSTWVENQEWAEDCVYISTDMYIEKAARRLGKTYNEVFDSLWDRGTPVKLMMRRVLKAQENKKDIIWDQTNTTVKGRARKIRILPDYYAIAVVFQTPDQEEHARRLNRPGKHIPASVLKSMIDGFTMPTEKEGFKEIWYT